MQVEQLQEEENVQIAVGVEAEVEAPQITTRIPPLLGDDWTSADELENALLSKEQREQRRLAKRPSIDHLPLGVGELPNGEKVALFDIGDRIVVERQLLWSLDTWLDTRVYTVKDIDDVTGVVRCLDEEMNHHAFVGFKHPGQSFRLAPKKGNPFTQGAVREAQRAARQIAAASTADAQPEGEKKRRGRPKGTKNRPRSEIKAEKEARKAERAEKKAKRKKN